MDVQRQRVAEWVRRFPEMARRFRDWDGYPPQHTFFYPEEEYHSDHLDALAGLCRAGFGDIEVHLHHDGDTAEGLRTKLEHFTRTLRERHGLLRCGEGGRIEYGFIHGNWALDNSRTDGRWCGVDNELRVLRETGCYADFTLPSAPDETQTRTINSIYYATGHPGQTKSHDIGVAVEVGRAPSGDLLLVQGPLTLNWRSRKYGLVPRIENGELSADNPPRPERVDLWVHQGVHVRGRPDWVFVKLHTHGAEEKNFETLLGRAIEEMHQYLQRAYNDGECYRLHYVTARNVYDLVKAAERGDSREPGEILGRS